MYQLQKSSCRLSYRSTKSAHVITYDVILSPLGRTAVHWAAVINNLEALKLLIRQGPDTIKDQQDSKVGGQNF